MKKFDHILKNPNGIIPVTGPTGSGKSTTLAVLINVIVGVIAQQLLPKQASQGRVAAFEIMLSSTAIRNMIREGKTHRIPSVLQTSKKAGMQTMDDCLGNLCMKRDFGGDSSAVCT